MDASRSASGDSVKRIIEEVRLLSDYVEQASMLNDGASLDLDFINLHVQTLLHELQALERQRPLS